MKWFTNPFKKKEAPIESPSFIEYNITADTDETKSTWRNNMWVVTPKGVGILFTIGPDCLVHLVNEEGETHNALICPFGMLRQAKYSEIPVSRRGDKDVANRLGYM